MQLDRAEAALTTGQNCLDESLVRIVMDCRAIGPDALARGAQQFVDGFVERFASDIPESVVQHAQDALRPMESTMQERREFATVERVLAFDVLPRTCPQLRELAGVIRHGGDDTFDPLIRLDDDHGVLPGSRGAPVQIFLEVVFARREHQRAESGDLHAGTRIRFARASRQWAAMVLTVPTPGGLASGSLPSSAATAFTTCS